MKTWKDPFPPTPQSFHLRVEQTLRELEAEDMKHTGICKRTLLLIAAVTALIAFAAAAVVSGHSGFKDRLDSEGLNEVSELVQEPHISAAPEVEDGFSFSIDEMIWEDDDLYVSYSLSVPEDGAYMVAMSTPTLNGKRLEYDPKGWTFPAFFDQEDRDTAVALLLGGRYDVSCSELWTFHVDPALKKRPDNHLSFRAVLLKYDGDIEMVAGGQWSDLLNPASTLSFTKNWPEDSSEPVEECDARYVAMMDAASKAFDDGGLTVDKLIDTGYVEYVTERAIDMDFDVSSLPETLYNDVAVHDYERFGLNIHINLFRMTHLGVYIDLTCSVPGAKADDPDAIKRLNDFMDLDWRFGNVEGDDLGYTLGASGGGGWSPLIDGTPAYHMTLHESALLSLSGIDQLIFAPCGYNDENESEPRLVYDMENAIALKPVYSEAIAEAELNATPDPTLTPEEVASWDLSN